MDAYDAAMAMGNALAMPVVEPPAAPPAPVPAAPPAQTQAAPPTQELPVPAETATQEPAVPAVEEPTEEGVAKEAAAEGVTEPSKSKQVWDTYKAYQALEDPEKGIGHVPSAEDVKTYYLDSQAYQTMVQDLAAGTPEALLGFINGVEGVVQGAGLKIIDNVPVLLKSLQGSQHHESPYGKMRSFVLTDVASEIWDHAKRIDERSDLSAEAKQAQKDALTNVIRTLVHVSTGGTGKFDPAKGFGESEDPERKRLRTELEKERSTRIESEWNVWLNQTLGTTMVQLEAQAESALASIKNAETKEGFEAKKRALVEQVVNDMKADKYLSTSVANQRKAVRARLGQQDPERMEFAQRVATAIVNFVSGKSKPLMSARAKAYLPAQVVRKAVAAPAQGVPAAQKIEVRPATTAAEGTRRFMTDQELLMEQLKKMSVM